MTIGSAGPRSLREAMERALEGVPPLDEGAAARLVRAGLGGLLSVIRGTGERASAVDLLAADALITRACQAAAEQGEGALLAVLGQLDLAGFEALLEPEARS